MSFNHDFAKRVRAAREAIDARNLMARGATIDQANAYDLHVAGAITDAEYAAVKALYDAEKQRVDQEKLDEERKTFERLKAKFEGKASG